MLKLLQKRMLTAILLGLAAFIYLPIAGCDESPQEEMEDAVEEMGDAVEEATD